MSDERRYREEEVEEILDLAVRSAEGERPVALGEGGLTLGELQEIGREVGIEPQQITDAALTLETRGELLPRRTYLGMPVSVGRTVELPRALTDREWEIVVADLRDTFAATGRVGSQGGAREWSNGNLRVLLEPTESGDRLRFSTLNRGLRLVSAVGVAELVAGLAFLMILVPEVLSTDGLTLGAIIALLPTLAVAAAGVGFLAWTRFKLPRWARERESQMEDIATRVRALVGDAGPDQRS